MAYANGIREPSFAGYFYPRNNSDLCNIITHCFTNSMGPKKVPPSTKTYEIFGAIVPHAALEYSGAVAAHAYYEISSLPYNNFVLITPNHSGIGHEIALSKKKLWRTPLGEVSIDHDLSSRLSFCNSQIGYDDLSHIFEHGIEVQLPFLQYIKGEITVVPMCLKLQDRDTSLDLGKSIANGINNLTTFLIASSDLSHYVHHEDAVRKDKELIDSILNLDIERFYSLIERYNLSICGYGAIATVMCAVKILGCDKGILLKYATSGDISGNYESVVGYSSILFI
jgi:MEMO1 family protein